MKSLTQLVESIQTHDVLNNKFYETWMMSRLPIGDIAIFVRNYWEVTFRFPESLALLLSTIEDINARAEYTKTLYSEMGNGNPKAIHSVLFEKFFDDLSRYMGQPDYLAISNLKKHFELLPETINLIKGEKKLYSESPAIAAGAQLALEWQAYTMIRKLYDGARNYIDFWPDKDSFHESCEFFYVHIGSAEKEHKLEALAAANRIASDDYSFQQIQHGFKEHLNLLAKFWNGIFYQINVDKNKNY